MGPLLENISPPEVVIGTFFENPGSNFLKLPKKPRPLPPPNTDDNSSLPVNPTMVAIKPVAAIPKATIPAVMNPNLLLKKSPIFSTIAIFFGSAKNCRSLTKALPRNIVKINPKIL